MFLLDGRTALVTGASGGLGSAIVKALIGLRVADTEERQGLDITTHGENAYN